tara:strand:- start:67 stop:240 length:174 start_codon:yes stop_codon:yes gene_type:complete
VEYLLVVLVRALERVPVGEPIKTVLKQANAVEVAVEAGELKADLEARVNLLVPVDLL